MKVLIISHNPISTYQNMGKTMLSLFSEFPKDEVYQLYIYPSVPDIDICKSYYRMTDKSVIKGVFLRHVYGEETFPNSAIHTKFENDKDRTLYNNPKNSKSYRQILRDIAWKIAPWWNRELRGWLERIKPDCIFLAPGNNIFIYDIALKIASKYKIGIISYICDDYYFIKQPKRLLERIRSYFVRRKIRETLGKSQAIVTICEELRQIYSDYFKKQTIMIMTGSNYEIATEIKSKKEINSITYMGNLSCNRDVSIYDVGATLDQLNKTSEKKYYLDIYANLSSELKRKFSSINSIRLHDFVSGNEFRRVFVNAELFLHVEDFSEESIDRVKHSVSTKIADVLASGIPLFAYGPENVASMNHLRKNRCAICVTHKKDLKSTLERVFCEQEIRDAVAKQGLVIARQYHNSHHDSKKLYRFIERICNKMIIKQG